MSGFSRIVRLSRELKKWRGCGFPPWGASARGFWDPPSHLVEYSYLDCLADTIQVRKTFSFGRTGAAFLRGKRGEGRREEEMKDHGVYGPIHRAGEAQRMGVCPGRLAWHHLGRLKAWLWYAAWELCQGAGSGVGLGTLIEAQAATSGHCWVWSLQPTSLSFPSWRG